MIGQNLGRLSLLADLLEVGVDQVWHIILVILSGWCLGALSERLVDLTEIVQVIRAELGDDAWKELLQLL